MITKTYFRNVILAFLLHEIEILENLENYLSETFSKTAD